MRSGNRANHSLEGTINMHDRVSSRRAIPAVSKVLEALGDQGLPRPVIVYLIRQELASLRRSRTVRSFADVVAQAREALQRHDRSRLQPVINGTGVALHTNFGRATLAPTTAISIAQIASNYSNLEFDLASGERGRRAAYLERNLAILCHAEAATVVNNCAAALVLIARHFAIPDQEVIISRGELVQIGGGFRIGDILENAGAKLREVGATNRTSIADYVKAISARTGMILKVHRSNFFMEGFVDSPRTEEIAKVARKRRIPFLVDLGSGAVDPTVDFAPDEHEPTPQETLRDGADLVCFSGDKLFGGAQAGIIAGKQRFISALKREPLFRALRCDKLCLAALQITTDIHLSSDAASIPALGLLRTAKDDLRARAANIFARLRGLPAQITVGRGTGKVGGGTLPRSVLASVTIDIIPEICSVKEFASRLRRTTPPLIGYIANNCFKIDLRTVLPQQDDVVIDAIRSACTTPGSEADLTKG
jgi:L-seryl-tRNA(Ser) seleniumtransferase